MKLKNAIIHELVKKSVNDKDFDKAKDGNAKINYGKTLEVWAEPVSTLIKDIKKIYGTKGNSSSQGTFDEASGFHFKEKFKSFLDNSQEFEDFSKKTMVFLKSSAEPQQFATGGYLVFGHYTNNADEMVIIAMVKKKDGFTLGENLIPEKIQEVDLSKIHQAVRINVNKYKTWMSNNETQGDEEVNIINAYLSFISPKKNTSASGYFIKAIGCSNAVADKDATKNAISAVRGFFDSTENEEMKSLKKYAKEAISQKLYDQSQLDNSECQLETIDGWVTGLLPEALQDEYGNGKFVEFANKEPYNVPTIFKANKSEAKKGIKLKIDAGDAWSLNIDRTNLGTTADHKVQFNDTENTLLIRDIPMNALNKIKDALTGE